MVLKYKARYFFLRGANKTVEENKKKTVTPETTIYCVVYYKASNYVYISPQRTAITKVALSRAE
jgi:hypothetical protein